MKAIKQLLTAFVLAVFFWALVWAGAILRLFVQP